MKLPRVRPSPAVAGPAPTGRSRLGWAAALVLPAAFVASPAEAAETKADRALVEIEIKTTLGCARASVSRSEVKIVVGIGGPSEVDCAAG